MITSHGPWIVMGVSGCGKSTIAESLAARLGGTFLDADDFHPPSNKEKMASRIPLTDEDREPWLRVLNAVLYDTFHSGKIPVLACSALKASYREKLTAALPSSRFIYLKGSRKEILSRLENRTGHFMPSTLLDSQFATLEEPTDAITIPINQSPDLIIEAIFENLRDRIT